MNTVRLGFGLSLAALSLSASLSAAPLAAKSHDAVQLQAALTGAGSDAEETNMGDLIADAVRQTGGADIALVAADEVGSASIPAGNVPASKIVDALHYADDASDTVVVLNLTGAQVLKAVERGVSRAPQPFSGFLQVSGLQVRYDSSAPEGKRTSLVGAQGSEISATRTYKVATTRPIADGGLGYFQVWSKGDVASSTGVSVADSLANYLSGHKTISGAVEGRITASR